MLLYQTWTSVTFALFAPFLLLRAHREELALAAEFSIAWQEYAARVPMILPGWKKGALMMKPQWIILILGFGLYVFALIPGILPHRMDMPFMIISGLLIGSLGIIGFDLPFHPKKVGRMFLVIGVLVFLAGIMMAYFGHGYFLFIVAVPSLGLALFGLREITKAE